MLIQIRQRRNTTQVEYDSFYIQGIEHLPGHKVNRQDVFQKLY